MGILANSASKTMSSSTSDDTSSGYLTREAVALSLSVAATTYQWSLAVPQGSTRATLSNAASATPTFTPDMPGYYVLSCLANGTTTYILRIAVADASTVAVVDGITLTPRSNASVVTPAMGAVVYYSSDANALVARLSDGTTHTITLA